MRPGPVVLRIKLRYDDVEAMIHRFAPNVGKTGLFLPTKSLQPLGAEIKFELRLSTEQPVLVGLGRVKAVCEPDPNNPKATFGMAIELMRVTRESRDLILKMLERRKQMGMPETGIPMPADIDAARRSDFVDTGVRDYTSGAIPQLVSVVDSSPTTSELMTSPRRQSGPMAVAKIAQVEPLPPEPARRRRVPVAELIASASGPIVASFTTDALDEDVDVAAVLARARVLAGSDLDGELEALRDSAAAPVAIDIEAASAELARQLGGAAVRRDRSARWAPPPTTTSNEGSNGHSIVAPEPAATETSAKADDIVAPEPAATQIDDDAPLDAKGAFGRDVDSVDEPQDDNARDTRDDDEATPVVPVEPVFARERAQSDGLIHDDADASQFEEPHEVEPGQIHDEIHRLEESDFEEVEHTQIGAPIDPEELGSHGNAAIADRLDAQLDEAEREDLGFSETVDAGMAGLRSPTLDPESSSGGFSLEEPPAGDYVIPMHDPYGRHDPSFEAALVAAADEEEEIEEIDDFEILAEADAEDADLLAAAAEQEISGHHGGHTPEAPRFELPHARPSFLSRLELDEDSGYNIPPAAEPEYGRFDEFSHEPGEIDPRILSAGHALRAFEDPSEEHSDFSGPGTFTPMPNDPYAAPVGEQSYTFAAPLPAEDFDAPHGNYGGGNSNSFVAPDAFDQSDVIAIEPSSPADDLESALEALDVDLDDLGGAPPGGRRRINAGARAVRGRPSARSASNPDDIPTARGVSDANIGSSPTEHAAVRQTGGGRVVTPAPVPKSGRVHNRATTEDGILIDFDDEES
ncbi:MAG: hypothetical protein M4D80_18210 [Myxococcota bacterium]|nr:hypothetical protein [Myxococcota bacterium]